MFADDLAVAWISARMKAKADPDETVRKLLHWGDTDEYGLLGEITEPMLKALGARGRVALQQARPDNVNLSKSTPNHAWRRLLDSGSSWRGRASTTARRSRTSTGRDHASAPQVSPTPGTASRSGSADTMHDSRASCTVSRDWLPVHRGKRSRPFSPRLWLPSAPVAKRECGSSTPKSGLLRDSKTTGPDDRLAGPRDVDSMCDGPGDSVRGDDAPGVRSALHETVLGLHRNAETPDDARPRTSCRGCPAESRTCATKSEGPSGPSLLRGRRPAPALCCRSS